MSTKANINIALEVLVNLDYKILESFKNRRYHIAVVEKNGNKGLFKSPINSSEVPRLENEASLYKQLGRLTKGQVVYIPELLDSGVTNNLPWLIRPYLNKAFVDPSDVTKVTIKTGEAQAIIDFLFSLQKINCRLPNDVTIPAIDGDAFRFYKARNGLDFKKIITNITSQYGRSIGLKQLDKVLAMVSLAKFTKRSLNHEDYKLWHFYHDQDKLALIDGEYSNNLTPLHRDFSILFTSTFTDCQQPTLALDFLRRYSQLVTDWEDFICDFTAMTAWITIAELSDAVQANVETKHHHQLLSLLIDGEIRRHAR